MNKIIIVTGASSGFGLMAAQSAFIKGTKVVYESPQYFAEYQPHSCSFHTGLRAR